MKRRARRTLTGAAVVGGTVSVWAGRVLDGAGASFEFGPWTALWGGIAALVGRGLGSAGR